jgi:hypothetical protein
MGQSDCGLLLFAVRRDKALAITPDPSSLWVIEEDDPNELYLSGTFTVDPAPDQKPSGEGQVWRGTLSLPAVKIIGKQK